MSCLCKVCGEQYRVDICVPVNVWESINPSNVMMCGKCIIESLERDGYGAYNLINTTPKYLYHCTNNIDDIKQSGILWGNSTGDYSEDSARRTFLSTEIINGYGDTVIRVDCENYKVVDMGNDEYIINEPIAFYRDCEVINS